MIDVQGYAAHRKNPDSPCLLFQAALWAAMTCRSESSTAAFAIQTCIRRGTGGGASP